MGTTLQTDYWIIRVTYNIGINSFCARGQELRDELSYGCGGGGENRKYNNWSHFKSDQAAGTFGEIIYNRDHLKENEKEMSVTWSSKEEKRHQHHRDDDDDNNDDEDDDDNDDEREKISVGHWLIRSVWLGRNRQRVWLPSIQSIITFIIHTRSTIYYIISHDIIITTVESISYRYMYIHSIYKPPAAV